MAIIDRVEREARCGSVKILSAEIYNKQKKISLIFEHETVPDAEETERLKYYWKNKLKAGDAVQIEVRFRVPEANDPDEIPLPEEPPVFRQEPAAETVAVPFSIEEYEAASKKKASGSGQKHERLPRPQKAATAEAVERASGKTEANTTTAAMGSILKRKSLPRRKEKSSARTPTETKFISVRKSTA